MSLISFNLLCGIITLLSAGIYILEVMDNNEYRYDCTLLPEAFGCLR